MPTFQEQMELDLDVFINPDEFGIPAVYNPVIDDSAIFEPVSCNVIIDHDVILQPSDFDAQVVEMLHYAHRKGWDVQDAELARVRGIIER